MNFFLNTIDALWTAHFVQLFCKTHQHLLMPTIQNKIYAIYHIAHAIIRKRNIIFRPFKVNDTVSMTEMGSDCPVRDNTKYNPWSLLYKCRAVSYKSYWNMLHSVVPPSFQPQFSSLSVRIKCRSMYHWKRPASCVSALFVIPRLRRRMLYM